MTAAVNKLLKHVFTITKSKNIPKTYTYNDLDIPTVFAILKHGDRNKKKK